MARGLSTGACATKTPALDAIFRPRSVALVGASTRADCVGRQILENLLELRYPGRIFPVNPRAEEISGLRCYPSVRALEETPDLAVLVVPRNAVLPVTEDCVARGVGGLAVISGGFRELDAEGARLEAELQRRVRRAGIPLLGPNCMGLFNADPAVRLNLTFSPAQPRPGHIAFLSQSGALGAAVLTLAQTSGLAFSLFASLGNEAGITHRDALAYAAADPNTRVIVLYLETFEQPQAFLRLARRISRRKPIVCLKGGGTESGARAASSHTGALATSGRAFDAVMRQSGVILVDSTEEMLNVALGFSRLPAPRGRRVRVLTNAGGPGVLAADALAREGLELTPLSAERQTLLREFLTPRAPLGNPVDLTVEGTPQMYGQATRVLLEDPETDALLFIFVEPPRIAGADVLRALQEATTCTPEPVVAAFPAQDHLRRQAPEGKFALLDYPEAAGPVLGALLRHADWCRRPPGRARRFPVARQRVAGLIERTQRAGRSTLDLADSLATLRAYGIPDARHALVRTPAELPTAARRVGFPLALKVVSPAILHKTEVGGVVLNVPNLAALRREYHHLLRRLRANGTNAPVRGVLLQAMADEPRELILGFRRDPQGTPLLLVGWGGILVEAMEAVAVRILPVTDQDARDMLAELPGSRSLGAFRGLSPVAPGRVEESLLRLAQLATDFPAISEIDVNPFVVSSDPTRCLALDARVLLTT